MTCANCRQWHNTILIHTCPATKPVTPESHASALENLLNGGNY